MASRVRIHGKVELDVLVDENGGVAEAKAVSGPNDLRQAVEIHVKKWKYKPATKGRVRVRVWIREVADL